MAPLLIKNTGVDTITSFKFLGTHVTNDLTWDLNCDSLLAKARQRLYFLRKLKQYDVNKTILINFYRAIIESILTNSITVWFDRATSNYKYKLQSVVRYAEKIIGAPLPSLESLFLARLNSSTRKVMSDPFHPASKYFELLPSGRRLRAFKGNKRFINSFYPQAVKYVNGTRTL